MAARDAYNQARRPAVARSAADDSAVLTFSVEEDGFVILLTDKKNADSLTDQLIANGYGSKSR